MPTTRWVSTGTSNCVLENDPQAKSIQMSSSTGDAINASERIATSTACLENNALEVTSATVDVDAEPKMIGNNFDGIFRDRISR
jgi:hypothetical protein